MPLKRAAAPAEPPTPVKGVAKKMPTKAVATPTKAAPSKAVAPRKSVGEVIGAGDAVREGWGGAEQTKRAASHFTNVLKLTDGESVVLRFLDDGPYASYRIHWLTRKGRLTFICTEDGCPLCAIGDKPRTIYSFNAVKITDEEPLLYSLDAGVRVFEKLKRLNVHRGKTSAMTKGPLSAWYYLYTRTGSTKDNTDYGIDKIRLEDAVEEYGIKELTDAALAKVTKTKYTADWIRQQLVPIKDLEEIAEEILGQYTTPADEE